jgi:[CysO sulfur-carrier protein]-S-L-cysteine hydrolase
VVTEAFEAEHRPHPGPPSITLPVAIREAIVAHARAEAPNEACGIIVGDRPAAEGGRPLRFEPAGNEAASRYLYRLDARDLLRLTLETDDRDEVFWAIVHSHTHTPAVPSPTDIRQANYPDALYILVTLAEAEADPATREPGVRAWRIRENEIFEIAVQSEAAAA